MIAFSTEQQKRQWRATQKRNGDYFLPQEPELGRRLRQGLTKVPVNVASPFHATIIARAH